MILTVGQTVQYSDDFINRMGCPQFSGLIGRIDFVGMSILGVTWENGVSTGGHHNCFKSYSAVADSAIAEARRERLALERRFPFLVNGDRK